MSKSIVAIDVGFGNTKTVWASPGQEGYDPDKEICFSSVTPACHLPHLEKAGGSVVAHWIGCSSRWMGVISTSARNPP